MLALVSDKKKIKNYLHKYRASQTVCRVSSTTKIIASAYSRFSFASRTISGMYTDAVLVLAN